MELNIQKISFETFGETIKLVMLYYKEHHKEKLHRIEAEELLKEKNNICYLLLINGQPNGMFVYEKTSEVFLLKMFVLSPLVRKTKKGLQLWNFMIKLFEGKPAIFGVNRNNEYISNFVKKRAKFIGSYLNISNTPIDYYNLTFKEQ